MRTLILIITFLFLSRVEDSNGLEKRVNMKQTSGNAPEGKALQPSNDGSPSLFQKIKSVFTGKPSKSPASEKKEERKKQAENIEKGKEKVVGLEVSAKKAAAGVAVDAEAKSKKEDELYFAKQMKIIRQEKDTCTSTCSQKCDDPKGFLKTSSKKSNTTSNFSNIFLSLFFVSGIHIYHYND